MSRKIIYILVLIGFLCLPFGWVEPFREAAAESIGPPTVSSEGFAGAEVSSPSYNPILVPGQATDDNVPGEAELPVFEPGENLQPAAPIQDLNIHSDEISANETRAGSCNTILWDNGPMVTHPGGGFNGNDASVLQSALGLNTYGFGTSYSLGYRVADDFEVLQLSGWRIEELTLFAYQTGTYTYPPNSTITAAYLQIWDGPPNDAGSSVIFGNMVTNRMTDSYWTGIYRSIDTNLTNDQRPIMAVEVFIGVTLHPGTYWLDWAFEGTGTSGPWALPISILGQTTTGNALQTTDGGTVWNPVNDSGTATQQGLPFLLRGCFGTWLWDQPLSSENQSAYVDQNLPDFPDYSSFLADDFVVQKSWKIDSIFVPGGGWNGFTSLMNADSLHWAIYADNGGIPAGDPSGGGNPPVWSLSLLPTDFRVTISNGSNGQPSDTYLVFPIPLILPPGHYWLIFYPSMNFSSYGQFGRQPANTENGYTGQFINPGNGFSYGPNWQEWTVLGPTQRDIAFNIGGEVVGTWKSISPINSTGRSRPAAAAVNSKIYLFGGEISGGRENRVERYDPKTNSWTTMAGLMPYPASNICAAAIGNDIYIPGGYSATAEYLSNLQVYRTKTDTWSTITTDPLPIGLSGAGCAALNGKLYVFGGVASGSVFHNGAYVYDPAAPAGSRWTILANMSHERAYLAGAAINGKIYAIGGRSGAISDMPYVEAYNPADGTWHSVTNLNAARGGPGAYSVGNNLIVCGGGWNTFFNSCELYDANQGYTGSWKVMPFYMLEGRRTFGYANIGPVLYAIAGYNYTFMTSAERWSYEIFLPMILK